VLDVMKDVAPRHHGKDIAARLAELGVARRGAAATSGTASSQ
jgi:hypothetical protein